MEFLVLLSQVHHLLLGLSGHNHLGLSVLDLENVVLRAFQEALQLVDYKVQPVDLFQQHYASEVQLSILKC